MRVFDMTKNSIVSIEQDETLIRFSCNECDLAYQCSDAELGELMGRRKIQPCRHAWTSLKFHREAEYWDENKRYPQRTYRLCPRCSGSGHYSYCQMYGTTCFQCRGRRYIPRTFKANIQGSAPTIKEARVGDTVIIGMILYDVVSVIWAEKVRQRMVQLIQGAPAIPEYDTQIVVVKARISGIEKRYWREASAPDSRSSVTATSNGVTTTGPGMLQVQRVPDAWRGQEVTEEHFATIHEVNRAEAANTHV